jgi:hypothetical protein
MYRKAYVRQEERKREIVGSVPFGYEESVTVVVWQREDGRWSVLTAYSDDYEAGVSERRFDTQAEALEYADSEG